MGAGPRGRRAGPVVEGASPADRIVNRQRSSSGVGRETCVQVGLPHRVARRPEVQADWPQVHTVRQGGRRFVSHRCSAVTTPKRRGWGAVQE